MWFSLFAVVLILAVTFYQGLQGVFTALINCMLTVFSAAIAFAVFENLYYAQLMEVQPDHGRAIALMGVFIITLLILRVIFDQLIKDNMEFPVAVDRAGGGVFGFITAMVIIGMLSLGFQMLPFPPQFLGFSRYTLTAGEYPVVKMTEDNKEEDDVMFRASANWEQVEQTRHNLWLSPDGFTVGLISYLSENALNKPKAPSFAEYHPDFLDALHFIRDGVYPETLAAVGPDAVRVRSYWYLDEDKPLFRLKREGGNKVVPERLKDDAPPANHRRMVVRVEVREGTGEDPKSLHLTSQQVRLFGRRGENGPVETYTVAAINDPFGLGLYAKLTPGQDIQRPKEGPVGLDLVFEVPDDEDFRPWFIEYKLNARAEIRPGDNRTEEGPPPAIPKDGKLPEETPDANGADQNTGQTARPTGNGSPRPSPGVRPRPGNSNDSGTTAQRPPEKKRGGRIQGVRSTGTPSLFTNDLPFELTNYRMIGDMDTSGNEIVGGTGRLIAYLDDDWLPLEGNETPLTRLSVPEGRHLLQHNVSKLHPGSLFGRAIGLAVDTVKNPSMVDSGGRQYPAIGVYAMAEVGRDRIFELVYFDELTQNAQRKPQLDRIKKDDLRGDYQLWYLFQIPSGRRIVRFEAYRESTDLRNQNLVAPED